MAQTSGLTVRQHERRVFDLAVEFVVAEPHRDQLRFSPMSTAAEAHVTRGTAVDISTGGLGLICRHFVPRMCEGVVRVFDPVPVGMGADGTPVHQVAFQHRVKVRRVTLDSHEPTYALGVAFVDPGPDIEQRVADLLKRVERPGEDRIVA